MVTGDHPAAPAAELTIEELADRAGMSVRNVRAHQSRGLLPGPRRRGRVGYYTQAHLERLLRIRELQAQGFNLASIAAILNASADGGADPRQLQRLALAPLLRHEPFAVPREALSQMFRHPRTEEKFRLAIQIGLLRERPDGMIEIPSRQVSLAAQQLIELGFHPSDLLDLQFEHVRGMERVAERFVELCLRNAWDPFAEEGFPPQRWREVHLAFERMQEHATVVLMGTFAILVRQAVERRLAQDPTPVPQR
jgi:DNA-binding transcriptional MerR regulator